ncbi:MAG: TetR/AcrR family transcriptional regulator, partial [Mobilitalea sp.]
MQYKKDELRENILVESEKEFFEKGYRNASLRQIAKRAGMTIGNL